MTRIVGMDDAESATLLTGLFTHTQRPEFLYRHKWRAGDFLLWDNCAVQHLAISDYALPQRRRMERTTLTGSAPF